MSLGKNTLWVAHWRGYAVDSVDVRPEGMRVTARYRFHPTQCPACGQSLTHHGTRARAFTDAPVQGKPVKVEIRRDSYRCRKGHISLQPLPDIEEGRRITVRCLHYLERQCLRMPASRLAQQVGLATSVVQKVLADVCTGAVSRRQLSGRTSIGIVKYESSTYPSVLLRDLGSETWIDWIPMDEWERQGRDAILKLYAESETRRLVDPDHLVFDLSSDLKPAGPTLNGKRLRDLSRQMPAPGRQLGFPVVRARICLWGFAALENSAHDALFPRQCSCCLAIGTEHEIAPYKLDAASPAKFLCTDCVSHAVPFWFGS